MFKTIVLNSSTRFDTPILVYTMTPWIQKDSKFLALTNFLITLTQRRSWMITLLCPALILKNSSRLLSKTADVCFSLKSNLVSHRIICTQISIWTFEGFLSVPEQICVQPNGHGQLKCFNTQICWLFWENSIFVTRAAEKLLTL